MSNSYSYEYFCGANVVVEINNFPIYEAAGLSYSIVESKVPLYGYSSRFFDAVSRGQVIVQGSILVNYVHNDYLTRSVEVANESYENPVAAVNYRLIDGAGFGAVDAEAARITELYDMLQNPEEVQAAINKILEDPMQLDQFSKDAPEVLKLKYWGVDPSQIVNVGVDTSSYNPHDSHTPVTIKVTFGPRNMYNNFAGLTGFIITGVFFTGRGNAIQIDENCIVEEFSFLARNVRTIQNQPITISSESNGLDPEATVIGLGSEIWGGQIAAGIATGDNVESAGVTGESQRIPIEIFTFER